MKILFVFLAIFIMSCGNNPNQSAANISYSQADIKTPHEDPNPSNDNDNDSPKIPLDKKYVFISSITTQGNMSGLSGADIMCTTLANDSGLQGNWIAWLSDSSHSAFSRISEGQRFLLDNETMIFDSKDSIFNGPLADIDINEFGLPQPNDFVWTGTNSYISIDSPNNSCNDWTSSSVDSYGLAGFPAETEAFSRIYSFDWTTVWSGPCQNYWNVYCFEE